jgi:hypothetical protein
MHLLFEKETRYYVLTLQRGLFGWVVSRDWGRVSARRGRTSTTPCESHEEAVALFHQETERRLKRNYRVVQGGETTPSHSPVIDVDFDLDP